MKKIFIYICVSFLGFTVNAQIKKGSTFLGGDLGYEKSETIIKTPGAGDARTYESFKFSPVFGKAIRENLIIGGYAGIRVYKDMPRVSEITTYDGYEGGVFVRKYKNLGSSGFYIFLDAKVGILYEETDGDYYGPYASTKKMSYNLILYPGVSYALSKKFHLETGLSNLLNLGYTHEYRAGTAFTRYDDFYLNSSIDNGSAFYLGFRVLFGK